MTDHDAIQQLAEKVRRLERLVQTRNAGTLSPKWIRIEAFCGLTGWPEETVREYRKNGTWPDGVMTRVRGRRIHVNLRAYDHWVDTGRVPMAA